MPSLYVGSPEIGRSASHHPDTASVKLLVVVGFASRYHAWKFQVWPGGRDTRLEGDREDAERISAQLERINVPYSFGNRSVWQARIAAALGNRDQAMVFLRRAFSEGTSMDDWIHREPAFRSMVDHPTIQDLLQPSG